MLHLALLCLASGTPCVDPATPVGSVFPITTVPDLAVAFSDGKSTRADVRFPSVAPSPCGWPMIVLVHGMGGTRSVVASLGEGLAEQGYLTIAYDVRGHGQHTGDNTHTSLRERMDLGELIEWTGGAFAHLCDATRVGVDGASMGGMHAWTAAAWDGAPYEQNPWSSSAFPDIDAVVCENTTPDFGANYAPQGLGIQCSDYAFLAQSGVRFDLQMRAAAMNAFASQNYFVWRAIVAGPLTDPSPRMASITCPVMAMMAWDDFLFPSEALTRAWGQIPASTPKKLYMGTGGHNSPYNANEDAFRANWRFLWFERWLKGAQNGIDAGPEIAYAITPSDTGDYLAPNSQWGRKSASAWPPSGSVGTRWYLRGPGAIRRAPPTTEEIKTNLVQAVAPGFGMAEQANSNFQLSQVQSAIPRATVAYETEPLLADFDYAGGARVHLSVSSAQTRWQLRARLVDVDSTGQSRYIAGGSFFTFDDHAPGAREIEVAIGDNAYIFRAGNKLRLELENLQIHDPPQGAGLRFAAYPNPFVVEIRNSPTQISWVELPSADVPAPIAYGEAKVNSQGCTPTIGVRGLPSATSPGEFVITAANILNQKNGMLLYSLVPQTAPFQGGWLYVGSPVRRTVIQNSGGGTNMLDCSGHLAFDFNALVRAGTDPILVVGTTVFAQYFTRDSASQGGVGLTNAVTFVIGP